LTLACIVKGAVEEVPMAHTNPDLDVRRIPPRQKHPAIMSLFNGLRSGQSFTLVNDHDPVPLYHQFNALYAGRFEWEYLESGPEVWRVRIGRTGADDPEVG
jgi:uncharacterized protein (DUF2249 family)